jgi:two-component system sensor histidine kinase BaeS
MRAGSRLSVRLPVAFALVALAAVALLATLTLLATRSEVSRLADSERNDLATATARTLATAYAASGSWTSADLAPAIAVAGSKGAVLTVLDEEGAVVGASSGAAGLVGPAQGGRGRGADRGSPISRPISVDGREVGSAVLRFPGSGLSRAESKTRTALFATVLVGAGLAVLLAIGVAIVFSRRITRPIAALRSAASRLERGELDTRVGLGDAPAEISDLGNAFDSMAETIEHESTLRRNLVADVAHELRTPITILQASCESLLDGVEEATPERLASLHEDVLRLGRLVGDLETLSAAEAAGLDLHRDLVDLSLIADQSADRLAGYFDAGELGLARRLEPAVVLGDASRLAQVADNLLGNALKFTPPGGDVVIEVSEDNGMALLRVTDTGPGIRSSELPHVFDRFWRGEHSKGIAGSGIGLAVVAELVGAHGGRVEASSHSGAGATFDVRIPLATSARGRRNA